MDSQPLRTASAIHVAHDEHGGIISDYSFYDKGELLLQGDDFSSRITWIDHELESEKNTLFLADTRKAIKIKLSEGEKYFTYKDEKHVITCDWVR